MMTARFSHLSRSSTLLLLLLGVANICQARIGDTLEEAIERYGKPVHKASADEFAMFKEASYYITAHFHDGKTDAITYVGASVDASPPADKKPRTRRGVGEHLPALVTGLPPSSASQESGLTPENLPLSHRQCRF